MKKYITESFTINSGTIPFTIKLISTKKISKLTNMLKEQIRTHLNIAAVSTPKILIIQNTFERFLKPLLDQNILIASAINGGGDLLTGVAKNQDFIWNIAIENPQNRQQNIYTYHLKNGAIATENALQENKNSELQQVTIVETNLLKADNLVNTALTIGNKEFQKLSKERNIHGVLINNKNTLTILE